ncbi:hypothetical protein [Streptomyces sp. NPDC058739]|uniref:hypothetical protein n=1 Tax=Streptomyces sp. NPDC058739 TaxID=3346618 RepID=UPI003681E6ED
MGQLAVRASTQRMVLELVASRHFDPGLEEIFRRGVQLAQASTPMPWWAPRRLTCIQVRLPDQGGATLCLVKSRRGIGSCDGRFS